MTHVVLFLCVANSARSQMAEGLARSLASAELEVFSAGSAPTHVHPWADLVLAELGISTDGQHSKGLTAIALDRVHTVITLCDEEVCPVLPEGVVHEHWPMPDPAAPRTGAESTTVSESQAMFREVRDQIDQRLRNWLSGQGLAGTG